MIVLLLGLVFFNHHAIHFTLLTMHFIIESALLLIELLLFELHALFEFFALVKLNLLTIPIELTIILQDLALILVMIILFNVITHFQILELILIKIVLVLLFANFQVIHDFILLKLLFLVRIVWLHVLLMLSIPKTYFLPEKLRYYCLAIFE